MEPFFADAEGAVARSRALASKQKWAGACRALRPLAEEVPGAVDLWLQIARWELADGRGEDASATLRQAIELNEARADNLAALWHALTEHLFEAQQWAQASEAAVQGVQASRSLARQNSRKQQEPAAKSLAAQAWERASASESQAERGHGELRARSLREHELLEMLATARAHEGRFEEAGDAMRSLLNLSPRDPLHRMRLASLLQSHGALGEASREFERVLESVPGTFFAQDAEAALDMLDKAQIQQILMRAGEQRSFGLRLERDLEGTLETHSFYLSESGRESLRQMIDDGRPDLSRPPRVQ